MQIMHLHLIFIIIKKYGKKITKVSDKETRQILEQIFGTEIDWQNLMWMYRAKRFYSMGEADVKKTPDPGKLPIEIC